MIKEDKELLLKDLSGRISYGVNGRVYTEVTDGKYDISGDLIFYDAPFIVMLDGINTSTEEIHVVAIGNEDTVNFIEEQQTEGEPYVIDDFKPYLRPMSSMTRQECTQLNVLLPRYFIVTPECLACLDHINGGIINFEVLDTIIDFYNSHHLDWRGLIPKGLALEAPKDMYKI